MRFELRQALRSLRRSPAFTIATVLTLALAIGGNAAIFSIVDAVLLKPLAIDPAGRLVTVYTRTPQGQQEPVAQPDLDDWRAMAHSFSGFASWVPQSVNVTGSDRPERVIGLFVSADFLPLLGVTPALGRGFAPGEDRIGGAHVAVLSNGFWRSRYAADPAALGKTAQLNGEPYTIIGVLPPSFVFPYAKADVYLPAFKYPNYSLNRAQSSGEVLARLRDGVSLQAARAEMDAVTARLAAAYPDTNAGRGAAVVPLREDLYGRRKPAIIALAAALGFVLLIACANVAGLMIARLSARARERAVRVALGASRAGLFAQVLAEAGLLAAAGGAAGLLLAAWAIPAIAAATAVFFPEGTAIELDRATLGFTAAITLAAAAFVALIPAWQPARLDGLRGARGAGSAAAHNRTRSVLVAAEISLAMVLLAGAGLTARSLNAIGRAEIGFDPQNLLMMAYRVPRAKYPTGAQQVEFHRQVIEKIKSVPGVLAAASVRAVPLGDNGGFSDFVLADRPEPPPSERPRALVNFADPGFFATLRIPVLRGRVFTDRDQPGATYVIVINQTLARRYFPDRDPIGRQLRVLDGRTAQIIGVVGDIKHFDVIEQPTPQIYGALAQNPFVFTSVAVRTAGDPLRYVAAIRQAAWQVDKDQPVWSIHTFAEILHNLRNGMHRLLAATFEAYAVMALLLAAIGIFGLVSYTVSQRTGEIGIRIALGARPADVVRLILRQGTALAAIGIAAGAAASAWLSRYLQSQLYSVSALDPAVYAAVAALLAAAVLAACLPPARRALRVDPLQALRQE